jgi:hypothetical protein
LKFKAPYGNAIHMTARPTKFFGNNQYELEHNKCHPLALIVKKNNEWSKIKKFLDGE